MKSKECKKHDHKLTKFLKVFIYMLVMLAPFFAIGIKCWYVANNENAYQSYSGSYTFKYEQRLAIDSLVPNSNYVGVIDFTSYNQDKLDQLNAAILDANTSRGIRFQVSDFSIINLNNAPITYSNSYTYEDLSSTTILCFTNFWVNDTQSPWATYSNNTNIWNVSNNQRIVFYNGNTQIAQCLMMDLPKFSIQCNVTQVTNNISVWNQFFSAWTIYQTIEDTTLSSVYYSAIQELDSASIFSWTTDTAIYTAINNMCVNLGIVSPPLAVLLTYWSLITAIYIVIDIVIETFTFLTHWFTDKMV